MATIKDIAQRTGLGLATISKYLNGGHVLDRNRVKIEAAIRELGYTYNEIGRSLKTSRSRTIGVVIPELRNLFITTIITAMEDILRRQGYGVLICDCRTDPEQEAEAVRFLLGKRVDGIINMAVGRDGDHLLPVLERGLPVVLIDRMIPALEEKADAVLVDNAGAARAATEALLRQGHREIGIILGPREVFTSRQRLLGYTAALGEQALVPPERNILYGDYTVEGGYAGMRLLLAAGVSAVFVTNYEMTLGAILAVNERGIHIPRELSFIGFDNLELSRAIRPRLTIVTQPLREIGEAAAELLLERLAGEGSPRVVTLSTAILDGDSVAGPSFNQNRNVSR